MKGRGGGAYVRKQGMSARHFDSLLCYVQCTVQYTVQCTVHCTVQCLIKYMHVGYPCTHRVVTSQPVKTKLAKHSHV